MPSRSESRRAIAVIFKNAERDDSRKGYVDFLIQAPQIHTLHADW